MQMPLYHFATIKYKLDRLQLSVTRVHFPERLLSDNEQVLGRRLTGCVVMMVSVLTVDLCQEARLLADIYARRRPFMVYTAPAIAL